MLVFRQSFGNRSKSSNAALVLCRYGDKAPKSLIGRLFSVLWILIGLVVITMFTATVTSALTNSALPEFTNTLEGMKVTLKITKPLSITERN